MFLRFIMDAGIYFVQQNVLEGGRNCSSRFVRNSRRWFRSAVVSPQARTCSFGCNANANNDANNSSSSADVKPRGNESQDTELTRYGTFKERADTTVECSVCLQQQPAANFHKLVTCPHRFCETCIEKHVSVCISESRVNIPCPLCMKALHPNDIKDILQNPEMNAKYENFMVRRVLLQNPDSRWCTAPNCG